MGQQREKSPVVLGAVMIRASPHSFTRISAFIHLPCRATDSHIDPRRLAEQRGCPVTKPAEALWPGYSSDWQFRKGAGGYQCSPHILRRNQAAIWFRNLLTAGIRVFRSGSVSS